MVLILSCSIEEKNLELIKNPNILLIIADDMGLDATPGYDVGSIKPHMPNLESFINFGISFNNVWATPECSPTRATILTGKYGFKTKVFKSGDTFSVNETSIFEILNYYAPDYTHALIGKWHLTQNINDPYIMGVDYFAGILEGEVKNYTNWELTQNGQTTLTNEYTTSKLTNLSIDWLNSQKQPWFLWLAYNAPHGPFHVPPNNLHNQGNLPNNKASIDSNPTPYYMAMIEAMDSEIGRLLNSMSKETRDNTIIIFIGDNGTPPEVAQEYPRSRTKWTLYEGGVNIPMIISGKNVNRFNVSENALIGSVDLFATIADLAGTGIIKKNDSKSFKELLVLKNAAKSKYSYTEVWNRPNTIESDYSIRNKSHKYIYYSNKEEEFYNLNLDPLESLNLLKSNLSTNDQAIKDSLINELDRIRN